MLKYQVMKKLALVVSFIAFSVLGCSDANLPDLSCLSDSDCQEGERCANDGICRVDCQGDPTICPQGQVCASGICRTRCTQDENCPPGQKCKDSYCEAIPDNLDGGQDGEDGYSDGDCEDLDGDGFGTGCPQGPDCDDEDENINPQAPEICADGKNNDCDLETDEEECSSFIWRYRL